MSSAGVRDSGKTVRDSSAGAGVTWKNRFVGAKGAADVVASGAQACGGGGGAWEDGDYPRGAFVGNRRRAGALSRRERRMKRWAGSIVAVEMVVTGKIRFVGRKGAADYGECGADGAKGARNRRNVLVEQWDGGSEAAVQSANHAANGADHAEHGGISRSAARLTGSAERKIGSAVRIAGNATESPGC